MFLLDKSTASTHKKLKNIDFIPICNYEEPYIKGITNIDHLIEINDSIGFETTRVVNSVSRSLSESTKPYSTSLFTFRPNSGLYFVIKAESTEILNEIVEIFEDIGKTGIGGRKSSGLGKFEIYEIVSNDFFEENNEGKYMNISAFLPEDFSKIEKNTEFSIVKRSGFYYSSKNGRMYKKKDVFAIKSGMILENKLEGQILDNLGTKGDVVYRVLLPMYVRIKI
jgi:CRISPR-associated protein Csm4